MNKLLSSLTISALTVTALTSAQARTLPAFAGNAQNPADSSCFTNFYGAVTNTCSTARQYCVALPLDAASANVTVTVKAGGTAKPVLCFPNAVTREGVFYADRPVWTATGTVMATWAFGSLSVPANGTLYACCSMSNNTSWASVSY